MALQNARNQPVILDAPVIPARSVPEARNGGARNGGAYNNEGKRGGLHGGAATDAALSSSRTILTNPRGNKAAFTGLQQFFSPPQAAELIASVTGDMDVLDFTAGSGALLAPYSREARYGIELDSDYIAPAKDPEGNPEGYTAIHGDAQQVVPMLRAAGARWPAVAINPPFGLDWHDSVHGKGNPKVHINSTIAAYLWALDLMDRYGQGAMVCGTGRLGRDVCSREESEGIYAIVDVTDSLFEDAEIAASIAFFVKLANRTQGRTVRLCATRAELPELASRIVEARDMNSRYVTGFATDGGALCDKFRAVEREHSRRASAAAERRAARRYDLMLKGSKVSVGLSAYSKLALANEKGSQAVRAVELLSGQHTAYFGQNPRELRQLRAMRDDGLVSVEPALEEAAEKALADSEKVSTPLFPVKPQMRLGWLTDLEWIDCKKDDPEKGYAAGESYQIKTHSKVETTSENRPVEMKDGSHELRQFRTQRKLLQITIGEGENRHVFDEGPENIEYLIEHFEIPDPGCVAERFPEEVASHRRLLKDMQAEIRANHDAYQRSLGKTVYEPFAFKEFQLDHMSRFLTKGRGLLAHEQGLGKSLMQMALAEALVRLGAKNQVLFVAPQDLLPQWQREARKFFGREMEEIRTPEKAREVAKRMQAGEEGWFITYFEALSLVGRQYEKLPEVPVDSQINLQQRLADYKVSKRKRNGESLGDVSVPGLDAATTRDACPSCGADTSVNPYEQNQGATADWNGEVCNACGYVHRRLYKKPAYSHLSMAFKEGVKVVDEVAEIRGDDSLRSKAIRGIARGAHFIGGTGTPMSNFLADSFWVLHACLGNASAAFPYDYEGGKAKFENDFCVIEHMMGRESDGEENQKKRRKILPMVANVSQFWRLAQPSISRCRKEQTGEPLVPRTYYPVRVPLGVAQKRMNDFWAKEENFASYFAHKFPNHPMIEAGMVEKYAAALGQLWRLETAATLPSSDEPTAEYPRAAGEVGEVSDYTPATLKVLELAIEHAERGEKVLVGSDLILSGKWFADRLREKGIKAVHITEQSRDGSVGTKNPRKRSREIQQFVEGDAQVLCVGVGAVKLGHNLDVASTVIVHGLPYSFSVWDQFIARVHRLTSEKEVSVYCVLPKGSLAEQKYSLLSQKGGASDLAYDGELQVQPEKATDWSKVIEDMRERGIRSVGEDGEDDPDADTVLESEVQAAWESMAPVGPPPSDTPSPVPGPERSPEPKSELQPVLAGFSTAHNIDNPHAHEQPALF